MAPKTSTRGSSRGRRLTVGVVQAVPVVLDLAGTIEKAVDLIAEAGRRSVGLLAFPETWAPGYPFWCDMGTLGKWDHRPSKQLHARLWRNSLQVPSPHTERLCKAARKARTALVFGFNEQDDCNGTIYNSLLFVTEAGEIVGKHRKLVPTFGERLVWGQGDGSGLRTHHLSGTRVGGLICWEHWMPLARHVLHSEGEEIHVAAWPHVLERHQIASRHYAFEGRCYVLAAASFLTRSAIPRDFELLNDLTDAPEVLLDGGSCVIGPDGNFVAGPITGREELLVAEIDLNRTAEERQSLDVAGHYSRPDIFELTVDRRPRPQFHER